jgi:hypothetical protein
MADRNDRAADRARRRAERRGTAAEPQEARNGTHADGNEHPTLARAAKDAAAAAALGAAVGAARALATRQPAHEDDEPSDDEHDEHDADRHDEEPAATHEEVPDEPERRERVDERPREEAPPRRARSDRRRSQGDIGAVAARAREAFEAVTGLEPESVTSLVASDGGWSARVEVVEIRRIPDSTDVLASYELELDEDGGLKGYERVRRYYRAQSDDDE